MATFDYVTYNKGQILEAARQVYDTALRGVNDITRAIRRLEEDGDAAYFERNVDDILSVLKNMNSSMRTDLLLKYTVALARAEEKDVSRVID